MRVKTHECEDRATPNPVTRKNSQDKSKPEERNNRSGDTASGMTGRKETEGRRPKLLINGLRFPTSEFQEGETRMERSRNSKVSKFN